MSSSSSSSPRLRSGVNPPAAAASCSPSPEWRDWPSLCTDVLLAIFSRIPQADILRGSVALVCKPWRRVAVDEPTLWRNIDLSAEEDKNSGKERAPPEWRAMAQAAVHRSAGLLESFRGRADDKFLIFLAGRSPGLRSIHVTSWFWMGDQEEELIDGAIKKLPALERLVLERGCFPAAPPVVRALLEHCPRLEMLHAVSCWNKGQVLGCRLWTRFEERIRDLRMPKPCGCSIHFA